MPRLSSELLEQAQMLARREQRRPKDAPLRRSISTSYYALFHFLAEEVARLTVGATHRRFPLRALVGRALSHSGMKGACVEFQKQTPRTPALGRFWTRLSVAANQDVRLIAMNFVNLQELRHAADYDRAHRFTREDADRAANLAHEAINAWGRLQRSHGELSLLFAVSLMFWPALSSR